MEYVNKVELQGIIGYVRLLEVQDRKGASAALATNHIYTDNNGCPVVTTTWHTVIVWQGEACKDVSVLQKGAKIYVSGNMRYNRYTSSDGTEKTTYNVIANKVELLNQ